MSLSRKTVENESYNGKKTGNHWDFEDTIMSSFKLISCATDIMFGGQGIVVPSFCRPQPGDLIEIFRGTYQHWGLYVGRGEIVHLAPPSEIAGPAASTRLMSVMYDKATVMREELAEVAGSDKFHVNNLLDDKHRPRHVAAILRDAHRLLGLELPYCVLWGNCEHFVTELRYGRAESQQKILCSNDNPVRMVYLLPEYIHYAVKIGVRALAVGLKILTEASRRQDRNRITSLASTKPSAICSSQCSETP